MKRILIILAILYSLPMKAQNYLHNSSSFELGSGLNFSFDDGKYNFRVGGMMQPYAGLQTDSAEESSHYLNAKRVYFNLYGEALDEKVSFFLQTDFTSGTPLLDVWIGYYPAKNLKLYFGQKQSTSNNREMLVMEDQLQFSDRSLLSTTFSRTGRELGLFIEPFFNVGPILFQPKFAITSGDGINSFGADSRDVDLGGFKYSTRLDIYPFGNFTEGNDKCIADLYREDRLKLVLGGAASYNDGASASNGEGHGEFTLYNAKAQFQRPDYRQVYFDILAKYKGLSLMGEYCIATATGLSGAFVNDLATMPLVPTQISEYLSLGKAYNFQAGYFLKSGWGIDGRYSTTQAEFGENTNSIVRDLNSWKIGLTRYAKLNNLKITIAYGKTTFNGMLQTSLAELMCQVRF
ncbi:MAG: hypothetical protein GC181_07440 [Bacteroidetes bacterium]|nr:hypothetical protein [Bacteroidota bacterium]